MPYKIENPEQSEEKAYANKDGNTECVEFVRQTLNLPHTSLWKEGKKVTKGDLTIMKGTAIATFVDGKYPQTGNTGKHAAVYLGQDETGIIVLDQWRNQGKVKKRTIPFKPRRSGLSNDGNAFSVIETVSPSESNGKK